LMKDTEAKVWKGFTLSEQQARQILLDPANQVLWGDYRVTIGTERMDYQVTVGGELRDCTSWYGGD